MLILSPQSNYDDNQLNQLNQLISVLRMHIHTQICFWYFCAHSNPAFKHYLQDPTKAKSLDKFPYRLLTRCIRSRWLRQVFSVSKISFMIFLRRFSLLASWIAFCLATSSFIGFSDISSRAISFKTRNQKKILNSKSKYQLSAIRNLFFKFEKCIRKYQMPNFFIYL